MRLSESWLGGLALSRSPLEYTGVWKEWKQAGSGNLGLVTLRADVWRKGELNSTLTRLLKRD